MVAPELDGRDTTPSSEYDCSPRASPWQLAAPSTSQEQSQSRYPSSHECGRGGGAGGLGACSVCVVCLCVAYLWLPLCLLAVHD